MKGNFQFVSLVLSLSKKYSNGDWNTCFGDPNLIVVFGVNIFAKLIGKIHSS